MARIAQTDFDGMLAWELSTPSGSTALIAARGATLISWRPSGGADAIAGYVDAEELRDHIANRSLVMAPWAGRVAGGTYSFDGKRYELPGGAELNGLGGRVGEVDFERFGAGDALVLIGHLPPSDGYPWEIELTVTFALDTGSEGEEHLSITISAENLSATAAPLSLGWHPYLVLPGVSGVSNLSITVPARTKVITDSRIVPLPGDAAFAGIAAPSRVDYLGAQSFDQSFTNLVPDDDGVVVTELTAPASGARLLLTQEPSEAPVVHVFTADGLPRGARESIAVEPCSALSDAFNRADSAAMLRVGPGDVRSLTATLSYIA